MTADRRKSDLLRRSLRALRSTSVAAVVINGLKLVSTLVLARLLAPGDFGSSVAIVAVVGSAGVIAEAGILAAVSQRPTMSEDEYAAAFNISIVSGTTCFLLLQAAAGGIADLMRNSHVESGIRLASLMLLTRAVSLPSEARLQRELRFDVIARVEVAAFAIGNFLVSMVLALRGAGYWALICGFVVESALRACIFCVTSKPAVRRGSLKHARTLLTYGSGVTVARIANIAATQGDNLIVGSVLGASSLGLYSRAYALMSLPAMLVGQVVSRVMLPVLAQMSDASVRLERAFRSGLALIVLVTMPASLVCVLYAREILSVTLGSQWVGASDAFAVLGASLAARTGYKLSEVLCNAVDGAYRAAMCQVAYAAIVILGAAIGARSGLTGVAIGVSIAVLLHYVCLSIVACWSAGLPHRVLLEAHQPGFILTLVCTPILTFGESALESIGMSRLSAIAACLVTSLAFCFVTLTAFPRVLGIAWQDIRELLR